jgi:transcription elongation factor Elf1
MAILTKEQKDKYLASAATICPFCGEPDISGDSIEVESMECWQNVSCAACGETWRDVYTLAFVETEDELNAK